jgi:hypothetical protein
MPPKKTPPPEPWPPLWARKIGFVFGLALITFEAVLERSAHAFLYGLGFIFTGLPLAGGVEKAIDLLARLWRK